MYPEIATLKRKARKRKARVSLWCDFLLWPSGKAPYVSPTASSRWLLKRSFLKNPGFYCFASPLIDNLGFAVYLCCRVSVSVSQALFSWKTWILLFHNCLRDEREVAVYISTDILYSDLKRSVWVPQNFAMTQVFLEDRGICCTSLL